jgi:hypothetical protein
MSKTSLVEVAMFLILCGLTIFKGVIMWLMHIEGVGSW